MPGLEFIKTIADLGLVPVLIVGLVVVWRKWWSSIKDISASYESALARKDAKIAEKDGLIKKLAEQAEVLNEKRLDEYRKAMTDYRDTLDETNRRDAELSTATVTNQRLLERLLDRGGAT